MGSEHLMDVELSAVITRTEKRIEGHVRYIRANSHDQALQKVAKIHLAQMLSGLKRLETWRDTFR